MNICDILYIYMIYVVTQGGKDESKEGEFNLLFYAIKTRNHDAFTEILPKSNVSWQNSIGVFSYFYIKNEVPKYISTLFAR